jgi:hypothetical protein
VNSGYSSNIAVDKRCCSVLKTQKGRYLARREISFQARGNSLNNNKYDVRKTAGNIAVVTGHHPHSPPGDTVRRLPLVHNKATFTIILSTVRWAVQQKQPEIMNPSSS